MKPTLKADGSEMQRAFKEYASKSKRNLAELINQQSYSILITAAAKNRVADRQKIISDLGQVATATRGQKIRISKKGVIKRGSMIREKIYAPILYAIVMAKAKKQGRVIRPQELEAAAKKELNRRLAAIFFMKSGWFAALGPIAQAIGKPLKKGNMRRSKSGKGGSTAARWQGWKTFASFFNTSFSKPENTSDNRPTRWADQALQIGFDQVTEKMKARVASKLAALAKRQGSLG